MRSSSEASHPQHRSQPSPASSRGAARRDPRAANAHQDPQKGSSRGRFSNGATAFGHFSLPVVVGACFVVFAVVLVLVAWGCARANTATEESIATEPAQDTAQEETLPTDLDGVQEGTYYVELAGVQSSNLVLSATGDEDAGAYIVMQLGTMGYGASKQRLKLTIVDSDSCTLTTEGGLYLDCGDPTASAGLRLYANEANDSDGQKWEIQSASGGYRIVSKATGRAIEASSNELGAELVTDEVDESNASQVFRFVETSSDSSTSTSDAGTSSASGTSSDGSSSANGSTSSSSSSSTE